MCNIFRSCSRILIQFKTPSKVFVSLIESRNLLIVSVILGFLDFRLINNRFAGCSKLFVLNSFACFSLSCHMGNNKKWLVGPYLCIDLLMLFFLRLITESNYTFNMFLFWLSKLDVRLQIVHWFSVNPFVLVAYFSIVSALIQENLDLIERVCIICKILRLLTLSKDLSFILADRIIELLYYCVEFSIESIRYVLS